jgi:hypothetical protein
VATFGAVTEAVGALWDTLPAIGWTACACGLARFARCGTVAWTVVRVRGELESVGELEPQPTSTRAEIAVASRSLIA